MINIICGEPTEEQFSEMNEQAKRYYDMVYAECINNETVSVNAKNIFKDWWNGTCVDNDKYKQDHSEYSDKDYYDGHSLILWAVGQGCG